MADGLKRAKAAARRTRADDGMNDFQHATVAIGERRYADAVRLLHKAEDKAARAKPAGPVEEIRALREMCEAKISHGAPR